FGGLLASFARAIFASGKAMPDAAKRRAARRVGANGSSELGLHFSHIFVAPIGVARVAAQNRFNQNGVGAAHLINPILTQGCIGASSACCALQYRERGLQVSCVRWITFMASSTRLRGQNFPTSRSSSEMAGS